MLDRGCADEVVRALAGLVKAQGLYPPGHAAVGRTARAVEEALRSALAGGVPLLLGATEGYLVLGPVAFLDASPQAAEIFEMLDSRGVEGVVIEPEVRGEEVARFCAWLRSPGDEPWAGSEISLARLRQGKGGWERALRAHRVAVEALEKACGELQEGRIPDPEAARSCVQEFSCILAENPALLRGLLLLKDYDRYTFHHSVNVSILALLLAQKEGFGTGDMDVLGVSGLLHDIGKTRTPASVVRKPDRLTGDEWRAMYLHPQHGRDILAEMGGVPDPVPLLVYEHHMRFDGGGYPPRSERYRTDRRTSLVTVADVYDAMTTHRSYSAPLALPEAVAAIERLRGNHLPAGAVECFLQVMGRIPVGSVVRLAEGEVAVVSRVGTGGDVEAVRVVVTRAGTRLPAEEAVGRDVRPAEVVRWVNPLTHDLDPVEVLRHPG